MAGAWTTRPLPLLTATVPLQQQPRRPIQLSGLGPAVRVQPIREDAAMKFEALQPGMTKFKLLDMIANKGLRPKLPPDLSPSLVQLIGKCLSRDPNRRPPIIQVVEELNTKVRSALDKEDAAIARRSGGLRAGGAANSLALSNSPGQTERV